MGKVNACHKLGQRLSTAGEPADSKNHVLNSKISEQKELAKLLLER